ncbi:MAG: LytTR family DNA-binding domain-containing protein [Pseudomonadota bacterium]|nr:LytTR family DNA-binding domain-containing protein [Pseudomonadota bacterium]
MRILLVDDELPARERLRRLLAELDDNYRVVGEAENGEAALELCNKRAVDLVLLDIRMPGMDGLEAATRMAELVPPPTVILVTAYQDYALDAFACRVEDYLVKPVRLERLRAALERARVPTRPQRAALVEARPQPSRRRGQLTAHYRGGLQTVPIGEVIYLQAEQKYVIARHPAGQILVDESLRSLEEEFSDLFMRIHRSTLVARKHVAGFDKAADGSCLLSMRGCDERLSISRRHLSEVRRWLRSGTLE